MKIVNNSFWVAALIVLSIAACEQKQSSEKSETTEQMSPATEAMAPETETASASKPPTLQVELGEFNPAMAKGLDYTGELVYGSTWKDANGNNRVLFTEEVIMKTPEEGPESATVELHALHYVTNATGESKLIREIKDFQNNCGFENRARFMESSVEVTDIDKDGYGEITFAYRLGCSSELSPDGLKLMMLENGDKYAIRGDTYVDYGEGGPKFGGETAVDPAFDNAPEGFQAKAEEIWKEHQTHHNPSYFGARPYKLKAFLDIVCDKRISGTEPFWSVAFHKDHLIIKMPGDEDMRYNYETVRGGIRNNKPYYHLDAARPEGGVGSGMSVSIEQEPCNDGMSDNEYSLKAYVSYYRKNYNPNDMKDGPLSLHGCGCLTKQGG